MTYPAPFRSRRWTNLALATLFFAILFLPTADKLWGLDSRKKPMENRALATMPRYPDSAGEVLAFPKSFEAWFKDHFGFRSTLVRTYNRFNMRYFGGSIQGIAQKGSDGWFYYVKEGIIDYVLGRKPFTEEELVAWLDAFAKRKAHVESLGGHYILAFVPNKHTVYPQHMPGWLQKGDSKPTRLEQLLPHLQKVEGLNLIDLRGPLARASQEERVFHKTDSHWNQLGAFIATAEVTKAMSGFFTGLPELKRSAYKLEWKATDTGDLATFCGLSGEVLEESPVFSPIAPGRHRVSDEKPYAQLQHTIRSPILTLAEGAPIKRAVVLRDSFTDTMVPFLAEYFDRAVYLGVSHTYPAETIETERPDVVIELFIERTLGSKIYEL